MTIKEANEKVYRCLNFAGFIHEAAEAVATNRDAIEVATFSFGLSSIAQKMTEDLAEVTEYLSVVADAESESEVADE